MFELLFNYPASLWREATLVFDSGWSPAGLAVAIALALAIIPFTLMKRGLSDGRRTVIAMLQGVAATILLCMIWRPALLVSVTERGENTVAWVIDSSASMQRLDAATAAADAQQRFDASVEAVRRVALNDRSEFTASLHLLGDRLAPVDTLDDPQETIPSARSNIASGIETLLGSVGETALAAVVLVSDGADNSDQLDAQWWQMLGAAGVPVHTVGVGLEVSGADIELTGVTVPHVVQPDVQFRARVQVRHGDARLARVRVSAGGELLAAEDIALPADAEQSIHTLQLASGEAGIRQLEFSVEAVENGAGEASAVDPYPQNNRQARLVQVKDSPKRILYVEGEPRWEYKFLRRAMDDHPGVSIVSLLRTSPNKFYRQGVSDASELEDGFPLNREQLFRYDAVIIGSFEAAELSTAQQSALRDFVSLRGGSLLMLGGRQGLADGGWGRSVVAAALPVVLSNRLSSETFTRDRTQVLPTIPGLRTPWLKLAENDIDNLNAWQTLPALADIQSVGRPKPGALTLLAHDDADSGTERAKPLLVMQRYGRGQSAVLGTSGTWRWQMGLPSDDQRHELFWRQLLGALVEDSLPRLAVDLPQPVFRDADNAPLSVVGYAADYARLQQSGLPVSITQPDGSVRSMELIPDTQRPGRFTGSIPMDSDGPYSIKVSTPPDGESPVVPAVSVEQWWVRETGNAEAFDAHLHADFLRRISDTTGGSYLALKDIDQLQDILSQENAALKRENRLPLWNMPFLFLCLLLAKALEWSLRLRWKRL